MLPIINKILNFFIKSLFTLYINKKKDMTQHSEKQSKTPKGKPSGTSRDTAGPIEVDSAKVKDTEKVEKKYLNDDGETADNVDTKNVNRNTDKETK